MAETIEALVFEFGYVGLFLVSYLAATLLPLASEVVVGLMPAWGYNAWLILAIATLGNSLGALTNYYLGLRGRDLLLARAITAKPERLAQAQRLVKRWGAPVLFFSWLPLIGDPLTLVAGLVGLPWPQFIAWVVVGKMSRYIPILAASLFVLEAV